MADDPTPASPSKPTPEIRDAGPDAMKDKPVRQWEDIDEALDESFPASDPPAISPPKR